MKQFLPVKCFLKQINPTSKALSKYKMPRLHVVFIQSRNPSMKTIILVFLTLPFAVSCHHLGTDERGNVLIRKIRQFMEESNDIAQNRLRTFEELTNSISWEDSDNGISLRSNSAVKGMFC